MGITTEKSVGRPNIPLLNTETIFTNFMNFGENLGIDQCINSFFTCLVFNIYQKHGEHIIMLIVTLLLNSLLIGF